MKIYIRQILIPAALCLLGTFSVPRLNAQEAIGGTTAHPSALLDVQSAAGGILPPRMTTAERNAIVQPAKGLLLYNTTLNCIEMNVGTPERPAWGCLALDANPTCGAYIASGVWKAFKCHNLGADESAAPFTASWRLIGNYYQWGRGVVAANGPTGSSSGQANDGVIAGWNTSAASNGAWSDATKTANDPCPSGFRLPTKAQWDAVVNTSLNPTRDYPGSWSINSTNYSTGLQIGTVSNGLFLPAAGYRHENDGALNHRGNLGRYWSSTENGSEAWSLHFGNGNANPNGSYRTLGFSVRCIAE